jgi:hypothetical protein
MTDDFTCDECDGELRPTPLGGDFCPECQIFYTPFGFEDNWEIR